MDFSKFWVYGDFTLHSGAKSDRLWDAKLLLKEENKEDLKEIVKTLRELIPSKSYVIGIKTMGAVLGKSLEKHIIFDPKTKTLEGELPRDALYVILDDVLTTGNSVLEVIDYIGRLPESIYVLVVREDLNGGMKKLRGVMISEIRKYIKKKF